MRAGRVAILFALCVVLGGVLISGFTDFTTDGKQSLGDTGFGNVTVESVSLPDTVIFEQGDFGADSYRLDVPDANITFSNIHRKPILAYVVDVSALHYKRGKTYFLSSATPKRLTVSLKRETFGPDEVTAKNYSVQVKLLLRTNGTKRMLAKRNLTVEINR
jgi:hypothetical protein